MENAAAEAVLKGLPAGWLAQKPKKRWQYTAPDGEVFASLAAAKTAAKAAAEDSMDEATEPSVDGEDPPKPSSAEPATVDRLARHRASGPLAVAADPLALCRCGNTCRGDAAAAT